MNQSPEGVRMYRELCEASMPDAVRGRTWYDQSDWVSDNVAQATILDVYLQLMKDLGPISQAPDDTPEDRMADEIRDVADILWRAMDEETTARSEGMVATLDGFQPAGGSDKSTR